MRLLRFGIAAVLLATAGTAFARHGDYDEVIQQASDGKCHWDYQSVKAVERDGSPCVHLPKSAATQNAPSLPPASPPGQP